MSFFFGGGSSFFFDARSIPGCVFFVYGDKGITSPGGAVNWADQSGVGDPNENLASPSVSQSPIILASDPQYRGRKTLHWDRQGLYLVSQLWATPLASPFTEVVVGHSAGTNANFGYAIDNLNAANPECSLYADLPANSHKAGAFAGGAAAGMSSTGAANWSSPSVVLAGYNGNSAGLFYFSSKTNTYNGIPTGTNPSLGMTVGTLRTLNGIYTWGQPTSTNPATGDGTIAYIARWDRLVSGSEAVTIMEGLGAMYNLPISP